MGDLLVPLAGTLGDHDRVGNASLAVA
jgi:hypothetical protein